jgi:hypothetical protein
MRLLAPSRADGDPGDREGPAGASAGAAAGPAAHARSCDAIGSPFVPLRNAASASLRQR